MSHRCGMCGEEGEGGETHLFQETCFAVLREKIQKLEQRCAGVEDLTIAAKSLMSENEAMLSKASKEKYPRIVEVLLGSMKDGDLIFVEVPPDAGERSINRLREALKAEIDKQQVRASIFVVMGEVKLTGVKHMDAADFLTPPAQAHRAARSQVAQDRSDGYADLAPCRGWIGARGLLPLWQSRCGVQRAGSRSALRVSCSWARSVRFALLLMLAAGCGEVRAVESGSYDVTIAITSGPCPELISQLDVSSSGTKRWVISRLADGSWLLDEPSTRFVAFGEQRPDDAYFMGHSLDYRPNGGRIEAGYQIEVSTKGRQLAAALKLIDMSVPCAVGYRAEGERL